MTLNIKKASSLMDLSKRPFQCPNGDCNKFVSVNNLHAHFRYEHPSIDNLFTNFNERNKIQVYLNDIKYDTSQCIFILNVVAANSPSHTFTCKPTSQFGLLQILENPNPMLFLLTSRVRVGVPENQDSELESSETDETSQSCDDENSENYPLFKENDYVIIWLASNLLWSNLRCTISASTNVHDVRLNYYGTIQDLRNGPSEVHQNSRCLMLSHYHCDKMTENGLKSVLLDVEIHEA
ncbi:uncharacterized protein LOC109597700 isoform X2 [Aethina tumida]|nr:uncharacterized protein LOC109597700 isoform X2 [Aethina tumida]